MILDHLEDKRATVDFIAAQMDMSRTTLYRHLKTDGTSFAALLDETRKELAFKLVSQRKKSMGFTLFGSIPQYQRHPLMENGV